VRIGLDRMESLDSLDTSTPRQPRHQPRHLDTTPTWSQPLQTLTDLDTNLDTASTEARQPRHLDSQGSAARAVKPELGSPLNLKRRCHSFSVRRAPHMAMPRPHRAAHAYRGYRLHR
jgi:hypothetical protein